MCYFRGFEMLFDEFLGFAIVCLVEDSLGGIKHVLMTFETCSPLLFMGSLKLVIVFQCSLGGALFALYLCVLPVKRQIKKQENKQHAKWPNNSPKSSKTPKKSTKTWNQKWTKKTLCYKISCKSKCKQTNKNTTHTQSSKHQATIFRSSQGLSFRSKIRSLRR